MKLKGTHSGYNVREKQYKIIVQYDFSSLTLVAFCATGLTLSKVAEWGY